jgi:hypothetical protein
LSIINVFKIKEGMATDTSYIYFVSLYAMSFPFIISRGSFEMIKKMRRAMIPCITLLTVAVLQSVVFASGFSLLIEAEDMTLASGMVVGSDDKAFGGKYIHVPVGQDTRSPVALAEIKVSVPADSTYHLWARLHGPDGNSDAVYVTVNNADWSRKWPSETGVYEWVKIASYELKKGEHSIEASHGEIKARFDAFYLTDDGNDVPPVSKP